MITPINQNLNIQSNLKPVEVPHFSGITRVTKREVTGDVFEKRASLKSANNKDVQKTGKKAQIKKQEPIKEEKPIITKEAIEKFKKDAKVTLDATQKGVKEGAIVIKDVTGKAIEFTGAFVKSFYEDFGDIIREKGAKGIETFSDFV